MTAKHQPDRVEVMGQDLVECECSCGWEVASAAWVRANALLDAHVVEKNREQLNTVASNLFRISHPTAFSFADQPESTIETYTRLAEHVLERGYTE